MPARTLHLHLMMVVHFRQDGKRDVNHLTRRTHGRRVHIQRPSALGIYRRGIPALRRGNVVGLQACAPRMSLLPARLLAGRLALGLRMGNTDWILRRRDAAVRAGLRNRNLAVLKRGQLRLQLCNPGILCRNLLVSYGENEVHPGEFAILFLNRSGETPVHPDLGMQPLRQFRRVKILGESHFPEKLFAPPGEFHPVRLKAFSLSGIEVSFHTSKVGKRFDICKFNALGINGLKAVCKPSGDGGWALFGGPDAKFLKASTAAQIARNGLIFNHLKTGLAAREKILKKL